MNSKRQKVLLRGTPSNLFAARFAPVICARKNLRANKTNLLTSRHEFHANFRRALRHNKSHFCRYFARTRVCLRPTNTERTTYTHQYSAERRRPQGKERKQQAAAFCIRRNLGSALPASQPVLLSKFRVRKYVIYDGSSSLLLFLHTNCCGQHIASERICHPAPPFFAELAGNVCTRNKIRKIQKSERPLVGKCVENIETFWTRFFVLNCGEKSFSFLPKSQ